MTMSGGGSLQFCGCTASPSHLTPYQRCSFGHLAAFPPALSLLSGWICLASRLGSFGLEPCGMYSVVVKSWLRDRRLWSLSLFGSALCVSRNFASMSTTPLFDCLRLQWLSFRAHVNITFTRASSLSRVSFPVCVKSSPELTCFFRRLMFI